MKWLEQVTQAVECDEMTLDLPIPLHAVLLAKWHLLQRQEGHDLSVSGQQGTLAESYGVWITRVALPTNLHRLSTPCMTTQHGNITQCGAMGRGKRQAVLIVLICRDDQSKRVQNQAG